MDNPTPEAASTVEPSTERAKNSRPLPGYGKRLSTPPTAQIAELVRVIQAMAIIQDGLRQFVLSGGFLKTPYIQPNGILVLALKLPDHALGMGPDGNFTVDGISVMESRGEE